MCMNGFVLLIVYTSKYIFEKTIYIGNSQLMLHIGWGDKVCNYSVTYTVVKPLNRHN